MKTKVLIILFLTVALISAFSLKAQTHHNQVERDYCFCPAPQPSESSARELLADETWLTYTKTGAKIVTYSEAVFQSISLKWGTEFKAIHIYYKKDRNGPYKEYQILISQETGNNIRQWVKKNL